MENYRQITDLYLELLRAILELQSVEMKIIKMFFLQSPRTDRAQNAQRIKLTAELEKYNKANRQLLENFGASLEKIIKNDAAHLSKSLANDPKFRTLETASANIVQTLKAKINETLALKTELQNKLLEIQKTETVN